MVFRLGWAHSLHGIFDFSFIMGSATTTDGLRFGSSLQDLSSRRPHGQNLVYPIRAHYYYQLSPLIININGFCLFTNLPTLAATLNVLFTTVMRGSALPLHVGAHGSETHACPSRVLSRAQCIVEPCFLTHTSHDLTCQYTLICFTV